MLVVVYSIASCIPSNDFVDWCRLHDLNIDYRRVYDSQFPQINYNYTMKEIEALLGRKFHKFPVIYIDGKFCPTISDAKGILDAH
jgi:hypothetical protein